MDATGSFPTLAERLAGRADAENEARPITVWIEGDRPLRSLDDVRALLDEAAGADVVLVEPQRETSSAILAELATAAYVDSVCASVSYLPAAEREPEGIPPPPVDSPVWGVVYIRRDALDLALDTARALDGGAAPLTGSLRDLLGVLLSAPGFVHRRFGGTSPDALSPASPIRVTIDVRHLVAPLTGAQLQSLSLLDALARTGEVELTVLAPRNLHPSAVPFVEPLRDRVEFSAEPPAERADVFHVPHQIGSLYELIECLHYGRRLVVTHLDMITDRTPAYLGSRDDYEDLRRTTRAALRSADHIGFFSEHAALDAASEGIVEPDRVTVVPLGVDHIRTDGPIEQPAQLSALGGRPFLLVLGTAFEHKNRLFALRVLRELVERGWDGGLMLVGRDVPHGSSLPAERRLLSRDPRLSERVVVMGHVSESEKRGLYREAGLVLFPSLYEGFGLIPFEAAAFGTPCLYAWRGSVREFLPPAGALPADFSVPATASAILELLGSSGARESLVSEIQASAAPLTWDETARGYLEVYRRALARPPRPLDRAVLRGAGVGPDAMPLSAMERAVVQVYRRRRGFRRMVDSLVRLGALTTRAARLGR